MAWADRIAYVCHDFEDAVRAGHPRARRPARRGRATSSARAGRAQIGAFVLAVLDAIDRTGAVGMTEPAAERAGRVPGVQLRAHLPAARGARARPRRSIGLLRGLVDFFVDAPHAPARDATGVHADLAPGSPEAAAVAVRYVSGMTDRYALGLGVELLGWRPEDLPAGRVSRVRRAHSLRTRWASSTRTWRGSGKRPISSRWSASTSR